MSTPPPFQPGPPLDYRPPEKPKSVNRWWMIILRIIAGLVAGLVSGGFGLWLGGVTNFAPLIFVPPGIVLAALLFVCIKYRRFGYVSGFILAPFVAAVATVIFILIICGVFNGHGNSAP